MARPVLDRLRAAVEADRLRRDLVDVLREELRLEDLRELVAAAEQLLETAEEAADQVESWAEEEDREARADLRVDALELVDQVADRLEDLGVWLAWPPLEVEA